ncbi:MAG: ABC transporter substrate-binding protein [Aggregatilineales bacterium]
MKLRSVFVIAIAAMVCAGAFSPARAADKVTITISTWTGVDEAAQLQQIIDKINAANTDYQIIHQPIPNDYTTQVKTQLAGGTAADLYWLGNEDMALDSQGVFMPLTSCLANAPAKSAGDVSDYFPGILDIAKYNGQVYGLPWIAQPVVVFYNKDLFKAANLAEPTADWTWDDFVKDAKALTLKDSSGKATQWGFTANGWPPPQMFVWQAGGDVISSDYKTSPIDSAAAISAWKFYLSLAYNPALAPSADIIKEQGFDAMFAAGKVAMFMGGAADDKDQQPKLHVGVVSVPRNPTTKDNTTFAWVGATMMSASTPHPDLACKALLALTEGIQNWKIISPRISQNTVDHLVASQPGKKANAAAYIAAAQNMRALHLVPQMSQWNDVFWNKFMGPLLNGETKETPDQLAKEIRPQLEAFLPGAAPNATQASK